MARPKNITRRMRRTTVDIPILMSDTMRRAAWDANERAGLGWHGMFQRWLESAVAAQLERTVNNKGLPYWPLNQYNMPPVVTNGRPPAPAQTPGEAAGRVLMEKKAQELREALPPELVEPLEREPAPTPHYTYEPLPDEADSPDVIGTDRAPLPEDLGEDLQEGTAEENLGEDIV